MASNPWLSMQVYPSFSFAFTLVARLGQCFSTTRPIVDVDVAEIPDIEYDGYCFSDGVSLCVEFRLTTGWQNFRIAGRTYH